MYTVENLALKLTLNERRGSKISPLPLNHHRYFWNSIQLSQNKLWHAYSAEARKVFIGVELIYNIGVISGVQQSELVIHINIYTLFKINFPI